MPINRRGPVVLETRDNLINGLRSSPMSERAVDAALDQATTFAEKLVDKYSEAIAPGEVGIGGAGRVREVQIVANNQPTLLLYGRVQSGKTAAMILTTALCLDNGFRIVIVLTSDNLLLVDQTASRFKALSGPRVLSTRRQDGAYEWEGLQDEIAEEVEADGLVLVCQKNDRHLGQILTFLQQIDAVTYPTIIFDDEADAASPDTTVAARANARANAPNIASPIHRRIFGNTRVGQEGASLGEIFPHKLYVQVTATPYIFFLQPPESPIRPSETLLLEAGEGYCGGSAFFDEFDPSDQEPPPPPLVIVPPTELASIARRAVPVGLASSINFFLLAGAAKSRRDGWPEDREGFKHLSHGSPNIDFHRLVENHISRHLAEVRKVLRIGGVAALGFFDVAYNELRRTVIDLPPLDELVGIVKGALSQREILLFNTDAEPGRPGPRYNFFVGGNILGRGLTIDRLLVTWYVRQAVVSQMDTVWQHARMYGYRTNLMPYTRVYLPLRVAATFKGIHESEVALRSLLDRDPLGSRPVLRVPQGTRATRPNAIDENYLRVVAAGTAQIAPRQIALDVGDCALRILQILREADVPVDESDRTGRLTSVAFDVMVNLVEIVQLVENDPGNWHPDVVLEILTKYREDFGEFGYVYARRLSGQLGRARARLSGEEIEMIRDGSRNMPVLCMLYYGDDSANPRGWYPTLVMPKGGPSFIICPADV